MSTFRLIIVGFFTVTMIGTFVRADCPFPDDGNSYTWELSNSSDLSGNYTIEHGCTVSPTQCLYSNTVMVKDSLNSCIENYTTANSTTGYQPELVNYTMNFTRNTYNLKVCTKPDLPPATPPESNTTVHWYLLKTYNCNDDMPPFDISNPKYYQTSEGSGCCPINTVYLSCNVGTKAQNDPTYSKYGECVFDPNYTDPGTDTDNDGIPDDQDPDIDNDGIPNADDTTPYGDNSSTGTCGTNQHIVGTDGACVCDDGYINNGLSTSLNCVLDSNVPQCPSINEGKPLQQSNVTYASCMAMIDSNINSGGTAGNYLPLPSPAINGCCYFVPTDINNQDNPDDPCYYASFKGGFPLKETTYSQSLCVDKWNFYNAGLGAYAKNDDCAYGACYYGYSDTPPVDSNNTSSSNSNTDRTLSAIDYATGQQTQQLLNSNTNLGQKIDDIGKSEDGTYGASFTGDTLEAVDLYTDPNKVKSINDSIAGLNGTIGDLTDKASDISSKFSVLKDNITNSFANFASDLSVYENMFSNKPTVSLPSSGSCDLTASVPLLHTTLNLGTNMCPILQKVAPFFNFVFTLLTQFSLIWIYIRFFRVSS